jgi:shikimate dehydrogenase
VQPILVLLSGSAGTNPTQYMIEKAFAHHDLDWRYVTVEVAAGQLADAMAGVRAMGFRGGHCADAHKQAVLPLLTRSSELAAAVGVANVFSREGDALVGENLEGRGVVETLRRALDPAGKRVVLLGAGKLARAIGCELAAAGAAEIRVVNRTEAHAHELAEQLVARYSTLVSALPWNDDYAVPPEADVLIHATSLAAGDAEAAVPVALASLRRGLVVADATLAPVPTRLLHEAAARGCTLMDGLAMFVEQTALALRGWTGVDPDRGVMRDAAEEFLAV